MSNIFRYTAIRYFQLPQALVTSGLLRSLKPSSLQMYVVLLFKAQQHTCIELTLKNEDFCNLAKLSPNGIRGGRIELAERRLVRLRRGLGGTYTYLLCNPETLEPLSDPKKIGPNGSVPPELAGRQAIGVLPNFQALGEWVEALTEADVRKYFEARLPSQRFRRAGNQWMANCPFHADREPSLSLNFRKRVWYCHGCKEGGGLLEFEMKVTDADKGNALKQITQAIGHPLQIGTSSGECEATYEYVDEDGHPLYVIQRLTGKRFRTRRWDPSRHYWVNNINGVRQVLYHLDEVVKADIVIVCEGEKDADRVRAAFLSIKKLAVTTNPFGASRWRDEYGTYLASKQVFIVPDNDDPGRRHAEAVAESAHRHGATEVKVVHLAGLREGGDVSDFLDAWDPDELRARIKSAPAHKRHAKAAAPDPPF